MRSLLLWKRDRILFLAAILASCRANWISCWSRSSDVPELGVRLLTGLEGVKRDQDKRTRSVACLSEQFAQSIHTFHCTV